MEKFCCKLAQVYCLLVTASALFSHEFPPDFRTFPDAAEELLRLDAIGDTFKTVSYLDYTGTAGYSVINETTGAALYYWQINKYGSDIDTDDVPVIIWLEGGPGCSSTSVIFLEVGPYIFNTTTNEMQVREGSWLLDYHMIFIDAPVGTGFSIVGQGGEYVMTTQQYAAQMYTALQGIANDHLKWFINSRPMYIFGESYAGHWVPVTAAYILEQNAMVQQTDNVYLPLAGIGIGDGWIDPVNQIGLYSDSGYSLGLYSEEQRANISYYEQLAVSQINAGFYNESSSQFTEILALYGYFTGGANVYNVRVMGEYSFPYIPWLLNSTNKEMIGVPEDVEYIDCNGYIFKLMGVDISKSMTSYLVSVLQHLPVILWTGQDDYIVNVLSTLNWLANLDWPGQEGYLNAPRKIWELNGVPVGMVKTYDHLTFVTALKSGHMLGLDQLAVSRALAQNFISGHGFPTK